MEAHEGRVWFESQAGTTVFFLALPLAAREDLTAPLAPGTQQVTG